MFECKSDTEKEEFLYESFAEVLKDQYGNATGTKKIAALASYVIEGLEQGRVLVVDELDSSIHFKLTRAIAAMFNNELNTNAQMIFYSS